MAARGRGTLTVRKSTSPFFQPSSQDLGADYRADVEYDAPVVERRARPKKVEDDFEFGFLYQRANDDIGKGIPRSDSKLSAAMAKGSSRAEIVRLRSGVGDEAVLEGSDGVAEAASPTERARDILRSYSHDPHEEHPMYHTTNNQYGREAPTVATLTADRVARNQTFSNSFSGIKYRDTGLNTSLLRSQIHDALDFF